MFEVLVVFFLSHSFVVLPFIYYSFFFLCVYEQLEKASVFFYFMVSCVLLQEECLEKKFVVFDSEIDLAAHMIQMHPNRPAKRQIQVSLDVQHITMPRLFDLCAL